jgi:proteasome lid subunit RPN8/RPN11
MTLIVQSAELLKIREHGARDYPHECCGVLLGNQDGDSKVITEALALNNAREDSRHNRFIISSKDIVDSEKYARQKGLDLLGFYHSHPDHPARPSEYDREHAWPWWSYVIVSVQQGRPAELTSWVLAEDRTRFEEEHVQEA